MLQLATQPTHHTTRFQHQATWRTSACSATPFTHAGPATSVHTHSCWIGCSSGTPKRHSKVYTHAHPLNITRSMSRQVRSAPELFTSPTSSALAQTANQQLVRIACCCCSPHRAPQRCFVHRSHGGPPATKSCHTQACRNKTASRRRASLRTLCALHSLHGGQAWRRSFQPPKLQGGPTQHNTHTGGLHTLRLQEKHSPLQRTL
jgi:hypothetical protein